MIKVVQFNNKFDVLYSKGKQPMEWVNRVPHKQWNSVPRDLRQEQVRTALKEAEWKWPDWLGGGDFLKVSRFYILPR